MAHQEDNIDIALDEETAQGVYSNLVLINHSPSEFVIDFIQVMPGMPKAQVRSRVILTPEHAKRFLYAMGDNVGKYEEQMGEIQMKNDDAGGGISIPMNFGPPGEA